MTKAVSAQLAAGARVDEALGRAARENRAAETVPVVPVPATPEVEQSFRPESTTPLLGVPALEKGQVMQGVESTFQAADAMARGVGTTRLRLLRAAIRSYCESSVEAEKTLTDGLFYLAALSATAGKALRVAPKPVAFVLTVYAALQPRARRTEFHNRMRVFRILHIRTHQLVAVAGEVTQVGQTISTLLAPEGAGDVPFTVIDRVLGKLDERSVTIMYACAVFYSMAQVSAAVAATLFPAWNFRTIARTPGHPVLLVLDELGAAYRTTATFKLWAA